MEKELYKKKIILMVIESLSILKRIYQLIECLYIHNEYYLLGLSNFSCVSNNSLAVLIK